MNLKKILFIILFTYFILIGCSSLNLSIPANANTAFRNFTLSLFRSEVASTTINLHYSLTNPEKYGITNTPITFGSFDYSETASMAYYENLTAALESFSYETLSEENQLTYDVLSSYIKTAQDGVSYYLYEEPLSPVTGIHAQLPVLLAEYEFYDSKDVTTYLALLETLPEYFESLIRFEKEKAASGLFMSDNVADEVIQQCNAFVEMGDNNYLLSTFEERITELDHLSSSEADNFINQNAVILHSKVLPAYQSLADAITNLKGSGINEKGLCAFPKGKDYYAYLVRSVTGSNRTIREIQKLIKNQISSDILDLQTTLEDNPSLIEETASIKLQPEEILSSLKSNIADYFPVSGDVEVEIKHVPKALEDYLSPAFYLIPSIDNYNENIIYINDAYSMDDISLFTTLAHEGYPGHLYQTTYYASTNPDPIRTWLNFTGYVEGWATYAEMCSYYICPIDKSLATLLQKNSSVILGLYAAADIGIHYDGWDLEDTVEHFTTYGIEDEEVIHEIYDLILGDPANYLSYYVGYAEILELKKEFQGTQMEFHKEILEIGPAPFEIIDRYMN